jgi:hypothetical protein
MKKRIFSIITILIALLTFNVTYRQLDYSLKFSIILTVVIIIALTVITDQLLLKKKH